MVYLVPIYQSIACSPSLANRPGLHLKQRQTDIPTTIAGIKNQSIFLNTRLAARGSMSRARSPSTAAVGVVVDVRATCFSAVSWGVAMLFVQSVRWTCEMDCRMEDCITQTCSESLGHSAGESGWSRKVYFINVLCWPRADHDRAWYAWYDGDGERSGIAHTYERCAVYGPFLRWILKWFDGR